MLREISPARRTRAGAHNTQLVDASPARSTCSLPVVRYRIGLYPGSYDTNAPHEPWCYAAMVMAGACLLRRRVIRNAAVEWDGPSLLQAPAWD